MVAVEYSRSVAKSLFTSISTVLFLILGFFAIFFLSAPRVPKNSVAAPFVAGTAYADAPSCGGDSGGGCGDSGACGDSGCDGGDCG